MKLDVPTRAPSSVNVTSPVNDGLELSPDSTQDKTPDPLLDRTYPLTPVSAAGRVQTILLLTVVGALKPT